MFDTIISRGPDHEEFLVQVDRQLAGMAVKHLSLYRGNLPTYLLVSLLKFVDT